MKTIKHSHRNEGKPPKLKNANNFSTKKPQIPANHTFSKASKKHK